PGDAVPSPEAALLERESRERLLAAVERLSDDHRDAIACRYLLELSEEETAAALGSRRRTGKARLPRALAGPRAALGGGEGAAGGGGMTELELQLAALGHELELPREPDLAPAVLERLEGRRPFPWRPVALAFAVVAVAVGAAFAVPQARTAILRFFHLGG